MARTARIWSDIDVAMIDFFAEKKADEGNPSLRVLAARLGMKHTRVGDLFNKTNGTPTLQEFIDLCLGFNVKPSNVLDEVIAKAARARAERTADEVADRIAANPDDFVVAASIDPHKRAEANTPRE